VAQQQQNYQQQQQGKSGVISTPVAEAIQPMRHRSETRITLEQQCYAGYAKSSPKNEDGVLL
jgi:hypothetical protein